MEHVRSTDESDIDLKQACRIVIRKWRLVAIVFLLTIIAAIAIDMNAPRVYQITSTIQIGNVDEPLITKDDARAYLINQNSLLSIIRSLGLKTTVEKLQKNIQISDIEGTRFLKLRITYADPDAVSKINSALVDPFIEQGNLIYEKRLGIVTERLKELDSEIERTARNIRATEVLMGDLYRADPSTQDDAALKIILLQNTLSGYENHINFLRNQRHDLILLIDHSRAFRIFDTPLAPQIPVTPNRNLVLIGIMAGFFLGIFSAFFADFLSKN